MPDTCAELPAPVAGAGREKEREGMAVEVLEGGTKAVLLKVSKRRVPEHSHGAITKRAHIHSIRYKGAKCMFQIPDVTTSLFWDSPWVFAVRYNVFIGSAAAQAGMEASIISIVIRCQPVTYCFTPTQSRDSRP